MKTLDNLVAIEHGVAFMNNGWKYISVVVVALTLTACPKKKGGGGGDVAAPPGTSTTGPGGGCSINEYGHCVDGTGTNGYDFGRGYWKGELSPNGDVKRFSKFAKRMNLCRSNDECDDIDGLQFHLVTHSQTLPGRVSFLLTPFFRGRPGPYSKRASVRAWPASGDNGLIFNYRPDYFGSHNGDSDNSKRYVQVVARYQDGEESGSLRVGIHYRGEMVAVGDISEDDEYRRDTRDGRNEYYDESRSYNRVWRLDDNSIDHGGTESLEELMEENRFYGITCGYQKRCFSGSNNCRYYRVRNQDGGYGNSRGGGGGSSFRVRVSL